MEKDADYFAGYKGVDPDSTGYMATGLIVVGLQLLVAIWFIWTIIQAASL